MAAAKPAAERRLILKAFCSNENYNYDCDFAYVDLDAAYVQLLLDRMDFAQKLDSENGRNAESRLGSFYYVAFWEGGANFFEEPPDATDDATGFEALYGPEIANRLEER